MTATCIIIPRSPARDVPRSSFLAPRSSFIARRSGVTLIEILVVVGIIGILVAVIGLVGHAVKEKGKRELTRSIMDTLMTAIEEFHTGATPCTTHPGGWPLAPNDPTRTAWNLPNPPGPPGPRDVPYEPSDAMHSPATAEDFYLGQDESRLEAVPPPITPRPINDGEVRSIEGLWVFLQYPFVQTTSGWRLNTEARERIAKILATLGDDAKTNAHKGTTYRPRPTMVSCLPFVDAMQVLDAWKNPLRYRYYTYRNNNRPFLWSAGPDGKFAPDPNRVGDPTVDPNGWGNDDIFSDRRD
ncbi:MAG: type II secretion system protein [Phycisphaerae bacterium]